jgi:hypothetical protein
MPIFGRDKRLYAPETGSGNGAKRMPLRRTQRDVPERAPGRLTKNAGTVGVLLMSEQEIARADVYFSVYSNELPLAAYFPAHVVAWLESKDSAHPRINVVHTELQKLMRLSAPAAINAVEMSTHYEIISWAPSPNGGKDILFLDDKQQAQLRQVERQLAALQKQFADRISIDAIGH